MMGLYILSLNHKNKIHIIFFLLTSNLAANSIINAAVHIIPSESSAVFLIKVGSCLVIAALSLMIILSIFISDIFTIYNIRKFQKLFVSLIIISQTFLIWNIYGLASIVDLAKIEGIWRITAFPEPSYLMMENGYIFASAFFYVLIMILWKNKTQSKREKKQASVLLLSFYIPCIFAIVYLIIIYQILDLVHPIAGDACSSFFLWILGVGYCIYRYRFLSVTPEYISSELLSNIEESVILMGPDKKIVTMNNSARELINGRDISDAIQFSKNYPGYEIIG